MCGFKCDLNLNRIGHITIKNSSSTGKKIIIMINFERIAVI